MMIHAGEMMLAWVFVTKSPHQMPCLNETTGRASTSKTMVCPPEQCSKPWLVDDYRELYYPIYWGL